jgi:hypothetical protein
MRRGLLGLLTVSLVGIALPTAADQASLRLADRMHALQTLYQAAYREAVRRVDQELQVDYETLRQQYQSAYRLNQQKLTIAEQAGESFQVRDVLTDPDEPPELRLFGEASLVLENELERSHLLKGQYLQACEDLLDDVIEEDALLRYFFRSREYKGRYGLLLKRMVWRLDNGESASARPLKPYTVFADRRQTPFLVLVSPAAFDSLAFLRSILLHELNHVLLYKEPYRGVERPAEAEEGVPKTPISLPYGWLFTKRFARTNAYQFHLMHEYYAFKAQLIYDGSVRGDPHRELPMKDRVHIEHLYAWTLAELSPQSREVIQQTPEPPIIALLRQLDAREAQPAQSPTSSH